MKIILDNLIEGKYYKAIYSEDNLYNLYIKVIDGIVHTRFPGEFNWVKTPQNAYLGETKKIVEVPESEVFLEFL